MAAHTAAPFPTVRSGGGLLPPDLLQRLVQRDAELGGFAPADYGLAAQERLSEAMAYEWRRVQSYWAAFQSAIDGLPVGESGVTETREQWLRPLLRSLGYHPVFQAQAEVIGSRSYRVQDRDGPVPLHLVSLHQDLDHVSGLSPGQRRVSPHAELQELLNGSADYLYGSVSNGPTLRLLRDSHLLTRLTYLEFDLRGTLEGAVYPDFVLLWLALHRSRLPRVAESAAECWLERWRSAAETQGAHGACALRLGVEEALKTLGTGLLGHPANAVLRARLRSGELTTPALYAQLLRLLYRILFLFVAEERGLLFRSDAPEVDVSRYMRWYALTRLRTLGAGYRTDERHDDLWRSVQTIFAVLGGGRPGLGLPELGGLFSADACPDLAGATLTNAALTTAVTHLSWVRVDKLWRRVSYRDMDAEELGGVYEALLEHQPDLCADEGNARFDFVKSGQRKLTGSYYTPSELVDELVKSALDPVIADRLAGARGPAEQERALLGITVCDSATGSGHFLVAAARRLARELARVKAGEREPSPAERREAVRKVIRGCLYGVDANPLAVDLCRLALWLEGHNAGRPLSFLDHRIKWGNSLIGATPELVAPGIPDAAFDPLTGGVRAWASGLKKRNRAERPGTGGRESQGTYLTGTGELAVDWPAVADALAEESRAIAAMPNQDAADVAASRERYGRYVRQQVDPARRRLDAWTAAFFWPLRKDAPPAPTTADLLPSPAGKTRLSHEQRAEVDAYYAALYGLTRDELRYVLDPQDVYGPAFPGETFRVLKNNELRQHGEYRTQRLVLAAWDQLGLAPRNRDGRYDAPAPAAPPPTHHGVPARRPALDLRVQVAPRRDPASQATLPLPTAPESPRG